MEPITIHKPSNLYKNPKTQVYINMELITMPKLMSVK